MKKHAVLVILLVFVGFAYSEVDYSICPQPAQPSVLWENQYHFEVLVGAWRSSWGLHSMDDFTIEEGGRIESLECWGLFESVHPHTFPFVVTIYEDWFDHTPGDVLWSSPVTRVSVFNTGDDWYDYAIYFIELYMDDGDYFTAAPGVTYWMEIYWGGFKFYWCCEDNGNMRIKSDSDGFEYDTEDAAFFRILGTPSGEDVESASWGEIKAGYSD